MKLMTKEIAAKLPSIHATVETRNEDKVFICKFFAPTSNWTWYVLEGEPVTDSDGNPDPDGDYVFFGYVEGHENEWGQFVLSELEEVKLAFGLGIERDLHFSDVPVNEVLAAAEKRRLEGIG